MKAKAVVDNRQDVQQPLDYSFKAITTFHGKSKAMCGYFMKLHNIVDVLREKPRARRQNGSVSIYTFYSSFTVPLNHAHVL